MPDHDLANQAARLLQSKLPIDRPVNVTRDQGIALISCALHQKRRKRETRRHWTIVTGAVTAAAATAALVVNHYLPSSHPKLDEAVAAKATATNACERGVCEPPGVAKLDSSQVNGHSFVPGSRLDATPERPIGVALASGHALTLTGNSSLSFDEGGLTHRFSVMRGRVQFVVKKQRAEERFLVNTPDAEIEVHGTKFDVILSDRPGPCSHRTRVVVSEGIVEVRAAGQRNFVSAGDTWPKSCASRQPSPGASRSSSAVRRTASSSAQNTTVTAGPSISPPTESETVVVSASDLAKQNDLFARATKLASAGQYESAWRQYDELLAQYPKSPLAESAVLARARLLKLLGERRAPTNTDITRSGAAQ